MDKNLQLDIVTPDRLVLSERVDYVSAHGVKGDFGVLPGHIPMLVALSVGGLSYVVDGSRRTAFVNGGFAEVAGNKVTVLAESSELADNIDLARAMESKRRAEQRLENRETGFNMKRVESSLQRALARIQIHDNR
ncbi:MAG: F0F1 ATP synthase subunit epsilon [Deltaproteobacteria bacterium]|jgi:F-type H+-transporting ATPase subunit epsilon|nr:F0F1 ATP synthase subunit epsilon [Deltaproteobacteria bacterium]